jgi:hypothetical protein
MDIKGLDYNTAREKLVMTEYGREIQKMIDVAIALPTKEERMRCAYAIIHQMEMKNPQVREGEDYEQTLWDHLYLMSRKQLDIDWPYDMSEAENILAKPAPMKHPSPNGQSRMRHYGRLLMEVFERLKTMPEGVERDELVRLTANQMKRDLSTWGHGTMDDEKVVSDLAHFTDGVIQLDLNNFKFDKLSAYNPATDFSKKNKRRK